jgi:hypothetical protein
VIAASTPKLNLLKVYGRREIFLFARSRECYRLECREINGLDLRIALRRIYAERTYHLVLGPYIKSKTNDAPLCVFGYVLELVFDRIYHCPLILQSKSSILKQVFFPFFPRTFPDSFYCLLLRYV